MHSKKTIMKYNPFKRIPPSAVYYFFIAVENLIPLLGYFFLEWTFKGIFLFYAVELCAYELTILPRFGLYVFTTKEYSDAKSSIKKFGIFISWILYSLGFFYLNMVLLVFAGLSKESNHLQGLASFIYGNAFFIIFIFADYIYWFIRGYIVNRKHRVIDPDSEIAEMGGFPLLIFVPNILVFVLISVLSIDDEKILFVMMLVVIVMKTGAQVAKRYRKSKKERKVKGHLKTDQLTSISDLISDSTGFFDMKAIIRKAIDVRHLPVEKECSNPLILVIGVFAFSIVFAVWFGIAVSVSGLTGSLPGSLILLILSAVLGFWGINRLVGKVFIRITDDKVFYRERGFRGYTQWEKNLPADFRGVLVSTVTNKTDDGDETKYYIKLIARDNKAVVLFESRFKREAYNALKQFAPALGLPALEEKDGIIVALIP